MKPWPRKKSPFQCWQNRLPLPSRPKLSIITPSFNQGRFLEETILSVLNQDYPNLEYIIIDGGSTDNSVDIIQKYESRLSYWVSEKDRGQAHAINKGLVRATGEIVGWINSDDVYLPWTFRSAIRAFHARPSVDLIWGSRILIGANSEVLGFSPARGFAPESMVFCINSETAFWRRKLHDSVGFLDEDLQFAMDLDFFARIHKVARTAYLRGFQGCFRCYGDNKSSTMQDVCARESGRLWKEHFGTDLIPLGRPQKKGWSQLLALRYPYTALLPYMKTRLRKGRKGTA